MRQVRDRPAESRIGVGECGMVCGCAMTLTNFISHVPEFLQPYPEQSPCTSRADFVHVRSGSLRVPESSS